MIKAKGAAQNVILHFLLRLSFDHVQYKSVLVECIPFLIPWLKTLVGYESMRLM